MSRRRRHRPHMNRPRKVREPTRGARNPSKPCPPNAVAVDIRIQRAEAAVAVKAGALAATASQAKTAPRVAATRAAATAANDMDK